MLHHQGTELNTNSLPSTGLELTDWANYEMRKITAQSAQTAQLHLGNNRTLAQLKVCIVMSIHNMEKVVVLNMLITNFYKYLNNCTDWAFHNLR